MTDQKETTHFSPNDSATLGHQTVSRIMALAQCIETFKAGEQDFQMARTNKPAGD